MRPSRSANSPGAAAFDALRRQQRQQQQQREASPASPPCDAMQPGATPCDLVQPKTAACKTNPPMPRMSPASVKPEAPAPGSPRRLAPITRFVLQTAIDETCDATQPHATGCNLVQPNASIEKTNPRSRFSNSRHLRAPAQGVDADRDDNEDLAPLTPRQLAAARLVAQGRSVPDVATELGLSRSTVWRWTRDGSFRAELRRLHREWAVALPRLSRRPPPPPPL